MTPEKSHPNLQYRLGCQAPLGRGDGVARKKRPSAFVANRACHPKCTSTSVAIVQAVVYSQRALQRASVQTTISGVPMSLRTPVATPSPALCNTVWAAKLRLAEATESPERKGLRPLRQGGACHPISRILVNCTYGRL
ncbi:MAG: hypothetical protein LHW59_02740 [Candidatus Cloacimonetes bacterium]|nr:hypothetical protein [Candidatus Cloacimonadota bacterium]